MEPGIRRAVLLSSDTCIAAELLGLDLSHIEKAKASDELSKEDIEQALQQNNGVVTRAAKALGLSRQALYRRMEKYSIAN